MKPWQIKLFVVLFRPLPIPKWVMSTRPRLADVLMGASGLGGAALRDWRPTAGLIFIGFALCIGVLMLVWHTWVSHLVEQRTHRMLNGLCLNCGYDLRATPTQCPECGSLPTTTGC